MCVVAAGGIPVFERAPGFPPSSLIQIPPSQVLGDLLATFRLDFSAGRW